MSLRSTFIAKSPARVSLWCETFFLYMKKDTYNHVLKYTGLLGGVQVFYILMSIVLQQIYGYVHRGLGYRIGGDL